MYLILIFPILFQAISADIVCPRRWKEYKVFSIHLKGNQTKCIKPFYEMVSRDEAQRRCQQMGRGFDLLEIHTLNENFMVFQALQETNASLHLQYDFNDDSYNHNKPQLWIGPKRVPFGGVNDFQYRSGCSIKDYNRWHKGQPNDHLNREDCVFMVIDDPMFLGQWEDYSCDTEMYYICQFVLDLHPPCSPKFLNLYGYNETTSNRSNETLITGNTTGSVDITKPDNNGNTGNTGKGNQSSNPIQRPPTNTRPQRITPQINSPQNNGILHQINNLIFNILSLFRF